MPMPEASIHRYCQHPPKDISLKEINRVMETALYNANIPNEYEVIHVLPYNSRWTIRISSKIHTV